MFDANRLLGSLIDGQLSSKGKKGKKRKKGKGGIGIGSVGGAADSMLRRSGVPGGALGLLGGLAIAAYEHMSEQRRQPGAADPRSPGGLAPPPPPPPVGPTPGTAAATMVPPPPPPAATTPTPGVAPPPAPATATPPAPEVEAIDAGAQAEALLLIEAMISAAKADGEIDADERRRILARLEEAGADHEAQAFVEHEMARPLDVAALAAKARAPGTAAHLPAEVYVASLLAIEVDTLAERAYLRALAQRLDLDSSLVKQLHASVGAPPPA